jgi:hypothetical protein
MGEGKGKKIGRLTVGELGKLLFDFVSPGCLFFLVANLFGLDVRGNRLE